MKKKTDKNNFAMLIIIFENKIKKYSKMLKIVTIIGF